MENQTDSEMAMENEQRDLALPQEGREKNKTDSETSQESGPILPKVTFSFSPKYVFECGDVTIPVVVKGQNFACEVKFSLPQEEGDIHVKLFSQKMKRSDERVPHQRIQMVDTKRAWKNKGRLGRRQLEISKCRINEPTWYKLTRLICEVTSKRLKKTWEFSQIVKVLTRDDQLETVKRRFNENPSLLKKSGFPSS